MSIANSLTPSRALCAFVRCGLHMLMAALWVRRLRDAVRAVLADFAAALV